MSFNDNPFAELVEEVENPPENHSITPVLEELFGFTLRDDLTKNTSILPLKQVVNGVDASEFTVETLEQILFDRLFICSDDEIFQKVIEENSSLTPHARENKVVIYLFNCYKNTYETEYLNSEQQTGIRFLIIKNLSLALKQPEIYYNQDLFEQLFDILKNEPLYYDTFFQETCDHLMDKANQEFMDLQEVLKSLYDTIKTHAIKSTLVTFDYGIFKVLHLFFSNETTADIFITLCHPPKSDVGIEYASTLLGALINMSITPKVLGGRYEHFLSPLDHSSNRITEGNLWTSVNTLTEKLQDTFLKLLKCSPTVRDKTLKWLANCLKANTDRGKLWNSHNSSNLNPGSYNTVSDGFMINLTNILLRLCQPFCTKVKVMKVDPTYCAVPNEQLSEKGVHLSGLADETCLVPSESSERITANTYSFVTECFYFTHRSIDLGYRVSYDRIIQLNQEIGRMERAYNEAIQQASSNSDVVNMLKDRMSEEMTRYLCHKSELLEPNLVNMMFSFLSISSYWLAQVSIHKDIQNCTDYSPKEELKIEFPLCKEIPSTLKCIPEFIVENIVYYLVCQRRFNPDSFEVVGYEKLHPFLTFILIFMGCKDRIKNPHIRAHLAEALESLLPVHKDEPQGLNKLGSFERQQLFTKYEYRHQIISSLLEVFVGIEMTGESVEFEQKFNYRRPMYMIMDYLWDKDEYEHCFKKLAVDAEQHMEAVTPPLFLKFVNLLLNDAVFLLDESLTNMAKLRELQSARENGEWDNLSQMERAQNVQYFHHIGMIAKFDNILGRETIKALERLTSKITIVFTHSTMVDRVAAMLNYFLLNLVGPNKKNFKVKDQKEYSFDPAGTVIDICKIYINLKESDEFCLAVSLDGRSYRPELFTLAEDVLVRIGGGSLIGELKDVAAKVAKKAEDYQENEDNISEVPEHFLDPIMSTIMTDPVILPSSKQTVDRNTIARHLLSDQTDPFNRAPLTMDQVIPNTDLAEEIQKWKAERSNNSKSCQKKNSGML